MSLLAVDPGLNGCGWALWDDDLICAGFAEIGDSARMPAMWGRLAARVIEAPPEPPKKVVVELMRIYTDGKSDPADILLLQGLAGALLGVAHDRGMETHGLLASVWKGQVPRGAMGARIEREIEQRGWQDRITWPTRKTWRNDVCHAIALAKYAAR